MNYIKKIKSLGFKKIDPIVICSYRNEKKDGKYLHGYYIKKLSETQQESKVKFTESLKYDYPRILSQYVNRIQSYKLMVSDVSLYLILVGNEFTFVISDINFGCQTDTSTIYDQSVKVYIKNEQLNDDFWKKCLFYLDKSIQRELLLKEIFKYG